MTEQYPIEKCKSCDRYNHDKMCMRNKLRCMFKCEEYIANQSRRIFAYNRAVSGEEFDTTEMFEHGKKVVGSGWKRSEG